MNDIEKAAQAVNLPEDLRQAFYQQVREKQVEALSELAGRTRGELLHNMYPTHVPLGAIVSEEEFNAAMRITVHNLNVAMLTEFSKILHGGSL